MAEKASTSAPPFSSCTSGSRPILPVYIPGMHDSQPGETVVEKELNRIYANLRKAKAKASA